MISTKGRYALRVMADLASQGEGARIPLKDIARRQDISKKYLEIIMRELVSGGLVAGASGKGGGYRLLRPAGEYTLGEILDLTETSMAAVACLASDAEPCPRAATCPTLPVWIEYDRLVKDFFHSKRLSDLVPPADGQRALK
ncbi:MAG: Rrf2 family transcriptional regulator [Clostridia bacterium]|nr:Rrf2 family transcriptional regulator [Clostridia bacterium]MBQ4451748.1 Rrf2 family transcriptional regulator [Clostridia bacterium]